MNGKKRLIDDFTISNSDDVSDVSAALYKEELNDQKIEKLGNRLTIISVILPCLIGAILVYGYFDIKKRVMIIHDSGQTQVDIVATEFESKLNAMEVELAKIKFSIEKDIPELRQQTISIQDEQTLLAEKKSDKEETEKNIAVIKESLQKITDQYQGVLHILDRTNQETLTIINENSKALDKKIDASIASVKAIQADIESKISAVKNVEAGIDNKIDSRIDILMDKKVKAAISEQIAVKSQNLDKQVADIELSVESKLATLTEATQILSENRATIAKLENNITELNKKVGLIGNKLQQSQAKDFEKATTDIDKKYVDTQIAALKKSLNYKIDQLDLALSRKILQYSTQLESLMRQSGAASKKKTESATQTGKQSDLIIIKPERGKIFETDLTQ